jgi:hypothetical protein
LLEYGRNSIDSLQARQQQACLILLLPLAKPDHRGHQVFGGNRDTPLHVIRHQMSIQNLAFLLPGQTFKDFSQMLARLSKQNIAPSLGNEHESE